MKYPKYEFIENSEATIFEFNSIGNKGQIPKVVLFSETNDKGIYNLSFGDKRINDGKVIVDDTAISNNGDRNMILATVVHAVVVFTKRNPDCYIFFRGGTLSRTRLYRMAISLNTKELSEMFTIFGAKVNEKGKVVNVPFNGDTDFFGFIVKRK